MKYALLRVLRKEILQSKYVQFWISLCFLDLNMEYSSSLIYPSCD